MTRQSVPRPRPRPSALRLEPLEPREAPATLVSPTKLTYQDADGDKVAVVFSKPILNATNVNTIFTFDTGTVDGSNATRQQLRAINLTTMSGPATGTSITLTAVRSAVNGGDGLAAVGQINATGIDLGQVTVDGDLGRIVAGDAATTTSGLKGLSAQSIGRFGMATGAPDLHTLIQGKLNFLKVKSDVKEALIETQGGVGGADGRIGSVLVSGSLIGGTVDFSGTIRASGGLGVVTVRGGLTGAVGSNSGAILASKLTSATIGGSVQGGVGVGSGRINSTSAIGSATVRGNVVGGAGSSSGQVYAAGRVGTIVIGGDVVGGSAAGTSVLADSGFIHGMRIASLTIGGSLIAGTDATSGFFENNGAIQVNDDLGTVLIKGSIVGNASNPAIIFARGGLTPTATTDVAIRSLRVLGRVEMSTILAGVQSGGIAANADAQIGTVFVGGDWVASSIAAGALPGADPFYGNGDDARMSGMGIKDDSLVFSKIGSVTIGGQVIGTVGGSDHFGFVAEIVGTVKVSGAPIPLAAGKSNDDVALGITGDFEVNEV